MANNLTAGVSIPLDNARYKNEYRTAPKPRKVNFDSAYGLCFRACLVHLIGVVAEDAATCGRRNVLNLIIESGHPNVRDADRVMTEIRTDLKAHDRPDVLGNLTIAR